MHDDVTNCVCVGGVGLRYGTLLYVTPSDAQNSEVAFRFLGHFVLLEVNERKSESWHPLWSDNLTLDRRGEGRGSVICFKIRISFIIIFIYCNWVVTRWQWLFYMYTKHEIGY